MRPTINQWQFIAFLALAPLAHAQWINYRPPGTPQTRDGKVNLAAPAPRAPNGKPDLSGVWHVQPSTVEELKGLFGKDLIETAEKTSVPGMELDTVSRYGIDIFSGLKPEEVPMRPEAVAKFTPRVQGRELLPSEYCLPVGFPIATMLSEVHKIIQAPKMLMMVLELDNSYRQIYTDGRALPKDPQPSWYGYSVGKWEGDTLVVETTGLNDKAWLDILGHPRSEAMRMVERYRRRDFGHLDVEITFNDTQLYTKPFSVKVTHLLQPESDILEYVCAENEKDTNRPKK